MVATVVFVVIVVVIIWVEVWSFTVPHRSRCLESICTFLSLIPARSPSVLPNLQVGRGGGVVSAPKHFVRDSVGGVRVAAVAMTKLVVVVVIFVVHVH